jgi:hypothetical protein
VGVYKKSLSLAQGVPSRIGPAVADIPVKNATIMTNVIYSPFNWFLPLYTARFRED